MSQPQLRNSDLGNQSYDGPMHPEVRQPASGRYPECGMLLITDDDAVSPEMHHHDSLNCEDAVTHDSIAGTGDFDRVPSDWAGTVYTRPMHAEVRQTHPGSCTICGMGLELEFATMVEDGPNPELIDFTRRSGWALS